MRAERRWSAACAALFLAGASGCATFPTASRGQTSTGGTTAIDRDTPLSSGRWSFFWGGSTSVWTPEVCTSRDDQGQCTTTRDPCDGKGLGQTSVRLEWYSVPLALLTLGMAVPATVTGFCSTDSPSGTGP